MQRIDRIRNCLKNNEIFFTTIASVLLSLMAIIVSYKVYEITKFQINMEYADKLPEFHLSTDYVFDKDTLKAEEIQIIVSKVKGVAKNIDIDCASYLSIEFQDERFKLFRNKFQLMHYLDSNRITGNESGALRKIRGSQNNVRLFNFKKVISEKIKEKGKQHVFIKNNNYVRISYIDFLGNKQVEFYSNSDWNWTLMEDNFDCLFEMRSLNKQISLGDADTMDISEIAERIISTASEVHEE